MLERLPGTYRSDEVNWTILVRRDAGKLYARENDSTVDIELIALTETRYLGPGLPAPIEFRLPAAGCRHQSRLAGNRTDRARTRAVTFTRAA